MPPQQGSEAGGKKLRIIRERQGMTQFDLALDETITQANYSKIERGLAMPSRPKLEAILDALQASFNERQEIFTAFGYLRPYPLPEAHEIEAACQRCQPVLDDTPIPAYLMDFVTRLLAWNPCFAKLQGVHETNNSILDELRHVPLFKSRFDSSRLRMSKHVKNIEKQLLAEMRGIRHLLAPYQEERWYDGFIAKLCEEPEFSKYWLATQNTRLRKEVMAEFTPRLLEPVSFKIPGFDMRLHFYTNREALVGDDRFRIVYLIPSDAFTIRAVERWLAEK